MIDLPEIYRIVCCISGTVLVIEFFMAEAKLVPLLKINNRLIMNAFQQTFNCHTSNSRPANWLRMRRKSPGVVAVIISLNKNI